MKTFHIETAITGIAYADVKANSLAEAVEGIKSGKIDPEYKVVDWDINTEAHRGGYFEVTE